MPNNIIAKKLSINLDTIIQKVVRTDFTAIIGDSIEILAKVSENGNSKDITGCTVRLIGIRADKSYFEQTEKIETIDSVNGELKIYPKLDVLSVEGQCVLGLVVEDEDETINIQRFSINVSNSMATDIIGEVKDDIETLKKLNDLLTRYQEELDVVNQSVTDMENLVSEKVAEVSGDFQELSNGIDTQINALQNKINGVDNTINYELTKKIKLKVFRLSGSNYIYLTTDTINTPARELLKKQYLVSIGGIVSNGNYNSATFILSFNLFNGVVNTFVVNLNDRTIGGLSLNPSVTYQDLSNVINPNATGYKLYVKSNLDKNLNLDSDCYGYMTPIGM